MITLLSRGVSVMLSRDTPAQSGSSFTNVTMLCLLCDDWLWPAGKLLSDWAKALTGRGRLLLTALCISQGGGGHITRPLCLLKLYELISTIATCFLPPPTFSLLCHISFLSSDRQVTSEGKRKIRKVHFCQLLCLNLSSPLCYVLLLPLPPRLPRLTPLCDPCVPCQVTIITPDNDQSDITHRS